MSLAHKSDGANFIFGQLPKLNIRRDALKAVTVGIATAIGILALSYVFMAGHPIIAIWAGLVIVYWMFFAGASRDFGNYSEHGKAVTLPSTSPTQEVKAGSRRLAIYEDMLRERGLTPKDPLPY